MSDVIIDYRLKALYLVDLITAFDTANHDLHMLRLETSVSCGSLVESEPPLWLRDETITASDDICILDVTISSDYSTTKYISDATAVWFYCLRQIWQICRLIDTQSAKILVDVFLSSHLDGYNAILPESWKFTTDHLQHLLNTASQVIIWTQVQP